MAPKFSLQSVLDYRHSQVEAQEIELGKLMHVRQEKLALLENLRSLHTRLCTQLEQTQSGDVDLFMVQHLFANINQVRGGIGLVHTDLQELEQRIEAKRQELITAKQNEETLGTLKSHEIERFQLEQNRQENRSQDDIYITQTYRVRHQDA
jgi:flagellar export protein FliJ